MTKPIHETRTNSGWLPCHVKRTKFLRKKEGEKERIVKHYFVQLLPAMNVVKRQPHDIRAIDAQEQT
jgi:hypothetical protein